MCIRPEHRDSKLGGFQDECLQEKFDHMQNYIVDGLFRVVGGTGRDK